MSQQIATEPPLLPELSRAELTELFRRWDEQAASENWPHTRDPAACADHFATLAVALVAERV